MGEIGEKEVANTLQVPGPGAMLREERRLQDGHVDGDQGGEGQEGLSGQGLS